MKDHKTSLIVIRRYLRSMQIGFWYFLCVEGESSLGEKAVSSSRVLNWAKEWEHFEAEHNSSKFNFLLDVLWSLSPLKACSCSVKKAAALWTYTHLSGQQVMSTRDTQHKPWCHVPSCNAAWSCSCPNVRLVVVSGRRVVRADHVASAQRGHLVHSGAVLAASPREAHLSVLWLRSLRESYPFTSLFYLCSFCYVMCIWM